MNIEELTTVVVDTGFHLHKDLGPGLLESVYECLMAELLKQRGLSVERQKRVSFEYQGLRFDDGLRVDLMINDLLVIELKSVEAVASVHRKQLLTYLKLLHQPVGLLLNFGCATFKEGCQRVVNDHRNLASSRLSINQAGHV
jgi:GxxExxY protein